MKTLKDTANVVNLKTHDSAEMEEILKRKKESNDTLFPLLKCEMWFWIIDKSENETRNEREFSCQNFRINAKRWMANQRKKGKNTKGGREKKDQKIISTNTNKE